MQFHLLASVLHFHHQRRIPIHSASMLPERFSVPHNQHFFESFSLARCTREKGNNFICENIPGQIANAIVLLKFSLEFPFDAIVSYIHRAYKVVSQEKPIRKILPYSELMEIFAVWCGKFQHSKHCHSWLSDKRLGLVWWRCWSCYWCWLMRHAWW